MAPEFNTQSSFPSTGDVPAQCTVLVIGGGPGGSYTAAALAREGVDVVLLEADVFPRYHVGESMLASMRHLLRFIGLDATFDNYGFTKKVGAAFKLNGHKREGYTDFLAAGGPENYAWNVVRSEADDLMFRHAAACGAHVFDGVRVGDITFAPADPADAADPAAPSTRPVRAAWARKPARGLPAAAGEIDFEYVVDASGRAGVLSTRYLKNRTYNQGLKNVASWGYWTGTGAYAVGTPRANSPFFEALQDESGWAWLIPLHNGTTSVGVVMNQEIAAKKKQAESPPPSAEAFYLAQLALAPALLALIGDGALAREPPGGGPAVKSASDYSYSAASYGAPGLRIVGDAGAFIDPYFSSGVHLALTGALSAAATICAARRGDCAEAAAARWHSDKVAVGYTRFLLVVLSAYRQIRAQAQPVLADFGEDNFDRAFAHFRPVIQGTADVGGAGLSQAELARTLEFCAHAFEPTLPEERAAVLDKLAAASAAEGATPEAVAAAARDARLTAEEQRVLDHINARKMMRTEDTMGMGSFGTDAIGGLAPRLERGSLGLAPLVGAAAA
ncbi:FAD/NAD-binding domain-containing protein [Phellopilus nigrolimitatus]|nr:FAD/NAD-binding domain-containing protein [Phellopilus nigrolimitatus]